MFSVNEPRKITFSLPLEPHQKGDDQVRQPVIKSNIGGTQTRTRPPLVITYAEAVEMLSMAEKRVAALEELIRFWEQVIHDWQESSVPVPKNSPEYERYLKGNG